MHRSTRTHAPCWLAAAVAAALWTGCAASQPPAPAPAPVPVAVVDLSRIGRLGVLHFTSVGETALEPLARREFLAAIRSLQPSAELVELGAASNVLERVRRKAVDAAAIRAIGLEHGVDAVLVGELWADTIDPVEFMQRARSAAGAAGIEIEGTLSAQIFETRQGAAIWSTSALGRKPITRVRVSAWGSKTVDLSHLEKVRAALVQDLVAQATADFRPTLQAPLAGHAPTPRAGSQPSPAKAAHGD